MKQVRPQKYLHQPLMLQCDGAHCGMHEWKILQIKKLEKLSTKITMNFVEQNNINH
jgi:hypothetical protein